MSSIKLLPRPQSPTRKTNICMHLVCISFPLRRTCSYIPCIYILLHLPPSCQVVLLHALPQIITSHSSLFLFLSSFYFPPRAGCLFRKRAKATDHPGLTSNLFISNYLFAFLICRCRLHLILLYMSFLALFNFCHSNSHHFSFTPSLSISHLFLCLPFSWFVQASFPPLKHNHSGQAAAAPAPPLTRISSSLSSSLLPPPSSSHSCYY